VLKCIRTQKINYLDNFWDLYGKLPSETAFYYPKFLAVLHIISDPKSHGFTLPPVDDPLHSETVTISKQVHLKTVAKNLDISYDVMRELNPELRHSSTPPTPYGLKVPEGKGAVFLSKIDNIPAWRPPVPAYVRHRVRTGETLSVIARRYRTSVRAIMALNGLRSSHYIKAGWTLKIPTKRTYVSRPSRPASVPAPAGATGKPQKYVVHKGDSLWKIAKRFGTTAKAIQSANGLHHTRLQIGQVLVVQPGRTVLKDIETKPYKVLRGDSPYSIASKHAMNLSDFLRINNLTPRSTIFPGQILLVRVQ
jgi:membrane-bound lytic murein transglycosylase D